MRRFSRKLYVGNDPFTAYLPYDWTLHAGAVLNAPLPAMGAARLVQLQHPHWGKFFVVWDQFFNNWAPALDGWALQRCNQYLLGDAARVLRAASRGWLPLKWSPRVVDNSAGDRLAFDIGKVAVVAAPPVGGFRLVCVKVPLRRDYWLLWNSTRRWVTRDLDYWQFGWRSPSVLWSVLRALYDRCA